MSMWVLDSADPPSLTAAKKLGAVAISRYMKKNLPNNFELSAQERSSILSGGFGLLYNAEQSANDLQTQSTSYFHDYGQALSAQFKGWGVPSWIDTPLSADTQVTAATIAKVMNNYSAFAAAVEPYGCIGYAQTNVISLLVNEGISRPGRKHWLPGSIAWSPGYSNTKASWQAYVKFPLAGLVQLGPQAVGWLNAPTVAGCDTNLLTDPTCMGFEWPKSSPYYPKPPASKETDMFITACDTTGDGQPDGYFLIGGPGGICNLDGGELTALSSVDPATSHPFVPTVPGVTSKAQYDLYVAAGQVQVNIPPVTVTVPPIVFPSFTVTPEVSA